MKLNSMLLTDFYKTIHHLAYTEGLDYLVSYWTPRMSRIEGVDKVVMFGLQAVIKQYLIEHFNDNFFNRPKEEVIKEYQRIIRNTMTEQAANTEFLEKLHDLGYLPIQIKAIPEGTRVNIKTPLFEIKNTIKGYGWVVNYLETLISSNLWLPITSATTAYRYRELVNEYFDKTVSPTSNLLVFPKDEGGDIHRIRGFVSLNTNRNTAVGDFSMRGMGSSEAAMASGAGHLTSFIGTATIPSIVWLEQFYNADSDKEVVGKGTPSTEHSVMSSYGREGEFECYRRLITEVFPQGNISIVSDTYDYWNVLTDIIPRLKEDILARDGKVIIRGDSGNPVDIICGSVVVEKEHIFDNKEDAIATFKDISWDYFKDNCDSEGYIDYAEYFCKVKDTFYKVKCDAEIISERGGYTDEDYYVVDSVLVELEEIELSPEQKGTVELLWETFGGYINEKGYKVLNSHIGVIYGDSITVERAKAIYDRLEKKGFAATNCTLGAGSYSYQYVTRDTYGQALEATHSVINGEERQIFKDPKTDNDRFKKSQKGMCYVYKVNEDILYEDGLSIEEVNLREGNLLEEIFRDGVLLKDLTLQEIRERLHGKDKF